MSKKLSKRLIIVSKHYTMKRIYIKPDDYCRCAKSLWGAVPGVSKLHFEAIVVLLLAALLSASARAPKAASVRGKTDSAQQVTSLRIPASPVSLKGAYASAALLVDGVAGGTTVDLSSRVKVDSADPHIATVDPDGTIRPHHNGKTLLTVRFYKLSVKTPVTVSGIVPGAPPDFLNDIMPVLTHSGCNQGACHGAASGKGGFHLSLMGYDPEGDYNTITRAAGARRIARSQPENSLILRKPTCETPHLGGMRIAPGSADYKMLTDWITAGCPVPAAKDPSIASLEVYPANRTLSVGQIQRFMVHAHYSDGSVRDATSQAVFSASDESTASVSPAGEAKATGPGEAAVVVKYQGLVATARVISPFGKPVIGTSIARDSRVDTSAQIDNLVNAKLNSLGLKPSPACSDGDFIRRASLDIIGQLPTPDEARKFLADGDPKRRQKLVDSLLTRTEYVDYWTLQWGDLLRCSRQVLTDKGMYTLNSWIRNAVDSNMPWDKLARAIILSTGDTYRVGPVNFYKAASSPEERAEVTSQVFLGVRIACAKCHNHPYDRWTQNQYYQFSAFFARVATKNGDANGELIVYPGSRGDTRNPRTQQTVQPCALVDGAPLPATFADDRREPLAEWITSPRNPFFAHSVVNRIWKHFMGRGFIEAVDDMKATNPPSNAPLFDYLASDLSSNGFDLKRLMRAIVLSKTYQRSAEPTAGNAADKKFYSHFLFKRMGAEQMLDALSEATGVPEKFAGYPLGMHAEALPDTQTPSYFLDLFGRPARNTSCTCERSDDPNLSQVLHLMNGADVNARLSSKTGRITKIIAAKLPDQKLVDELYLSCYSRYPTPSELKQDLGKLAAAKEKRTGIEDLAWALINSNEFVLNH